MRISKAEAAAELEIDLNADEDEIRQAYKELSFDSILLVDFHLHRNDFVFERCFHYWLCLTFTGQGCTMAPGQKSREADRERCNWEISANQRCIQEINRGCFLQTLFSFTFIVNFATIWQEKDLPDNEMCNDEGEDFHESSEIPLLVNWLETATSWHAFWCWQNMYGLKNM